MAMIDAAEKWVQPIHTLTIGAGPDAGGTRKKTVTVGGETTLPFMTGEGDIPHAPAVAGIVVDTVPEGWPDVLKQGIGDVIASPADWARYCVEDLKVDLVNLKLDAAPSPAEAAATVKSVLEAVDVPLIIWGCGDEKKDNEVMPEVSQAARGENCLLGAVTESNYRTMAAIGKADGHKLIGEAPVDINIGKQVNILLQDAGFDLKDVMMCQVTAALGYGFDYVYSIFERVRIAGLKGDKMMALPQIAHVGWEVWMVKEALADEDQLPGWGPLRERGPRWEAATAAGYLQAGANIVALAHPDAVKITRETIAELMNR